MKYHQQRDDGAFHIHGATAWRKVPRAAHFCAATRACRSLVVVVARECRGAKLYYYLIIFDFARTLEEIIALRDAIF
jgi:hypothetical protein